MLEWLHSPIVYRERPGWAEGLRKLAAECYAPIACMHHYLHMARGNFREYLKGERVRVKKYFYVLRPVLACSWIEAGYGVAPVEFGVLAERLLTDEKLKTIILDLIERKRAGVEMDDGPALPEINDFLAREIERIEHAAGKQPAGHADLTKLDEFFRATLRETWGAAY